MAGIDVSVCMVSLDSGKVLQACLDSLPAAIAPLSYEVILVDNASSDGTPEVLEARASAGLRLVRNGRNVGFTRATNQAIELSSGRHILWLNNDTLLTPGALGALSGYLDENPRAGIVGPKVLNPDGTFQPQCRRGLPTPWAALSYRLGLNRLFPRRAAFGRYLLSDRPVDEACQVDAVSGCCLMARRQVLDDIGPLDEDYFGFGEDIDWCFRAKERGWEVWYRPESVIVHLKGQGGAQSKPYHKVWGIHQAMRTFYAKHLRARYPRFLAGPVTAGIWISFALSGFGVWLGRIMNRGRRSGGADGA